MTDSPKRKLAAIMFTDMVGYTGEIDHSNKRRII